MINVLPDRRRFATPLSTIVFSELLATRGVVDIVLDCRHSTRLELLLSTGGPTVPELYSSPERMNHTPVFSGCTIV